MSRWGRGRGGSVAVPLDSALFRENSNCPSAARSAGTVGKWGITSFTSIRSAPYAFANAVKKPVQDQNSPLTVPAVETDQPPPKPKKFFKSRNAELYPPVPQITYAPPVPAAPLSPEHSSSSKEKKPTKRGRAYTRDSSSPELPRRSFDKTKNKKAVATKASKKEGVPAEDTQPPNKRYLVRNRNKVINYAEDGSNSPIPDFSRYESIPPPQRVSSPKVSPLVPSPTPGPAKLDVASPSTSKEASEERKPPPIVLRISKGTSRIVSTDSNEGFTSPSSDRHSSMDMHSDIGSDYKKSPSVDTISSPRQEGLKITIKCSGLNQEEKKKEKKKDKKEHKSHKKHHKASNSDDEPLKKPSSPQPGSDTYDLYKTLASPAHDHQSKSKKLTEDEIESELAKLDPGETSSRLEVKPQEPLPEPKPPETSGRARRNRPNINYSENDDYLDAITNRTLPVKQGTKTVSDLKRESRKGRKKHEAAIAEAAAAEVQEEAGTVAESEVDKSDLIDILSGSDSGKQEAPKKPHKKQKHKQHSKHSSPEYLQAQMEPAQVAEENPNEEQTEEHDDQTDDDQVQEEALLEPAQEPAVEETANLVQQNTQSSDSAYNSCPNELSEEESQRQNDVFKSPHSVGEPDNHGDEKPSVKLVITKKKGSIFKSKSLVNDNPSPLPARKRRHLYRHEWNDKGNEIPCPERQEQPEVSNTVDQVPEELTRVTKYRAPDLVVEGTEATEAIKPYTSVRCAKEAKEYYTVVRNVKKAHQIQEIGEFQEFNDDVEYLLDSLQDNNPISTRCLSAITLASKCTAPAFRMHLRAHGTVQKFFSALHDATNDQSLGLCTATVMFVLSQDRLNMDLDRESLELMLNLLESDVSHKDALDDCGLTSAQLAKTQERVRELCAEIKSQGKATHLDLDNITVGHLAMETLLSLTSKRAGEWFKEELRVLGGVDHIVRTIQDCAATLESPTNIWTDALLDVLRKADRCMRVLENVTQQNEDNQLYLIRGEWGGGAARTLAALLRRCAGAAAQRPPLPGHVRAALLDAALPAVKVLVNLSHSFGNTGSLGAQVVGEQPSVMEICLVILNNQDNFIPDNKNFEFCVCVLMLLINLVQNNDVNTQRLLNVRIRVDNENDIISRSLPALELIVDLFYKREDLAKRAEENTDALLDGAKEKDKKKPSQDDIDETVAKLLARAGTHMEHTMVGAYIALLLGHMAVVSPQHAAAVRTLLPTYAPLLPTLKKYFTFLTLTASAEAAIVAHVKQTQRIIEFMSSSDKEEAAPAPQPSPAAPYSAYPSHYPAPHYQTSPSDVPQDMSLSNLNYSMNYSTSSSDRMSTNSMEIDGYH